MDLCQQSDVSAFNMLSYNFPSKEQVSFNFIVVATILSYFRVQENKITVSTFFPSICHEVMGLDAMILVLMLRFKPVFSFSSFTLIKRLFHSPSLSAIRVISSTYLRLLIFLPAILIPACGSSNLPSCKLSPVFSNMNMLLIFM